MVLLLVSAVSAVPRRSAREATLSAPASAESSHSGSQQGKGKYEKDQLGGSGFWPQMTNTGLSMKDYSCVADLKTTCSRVKEMNVKKEQLLLRPNHHIVLYGSSKVRELAEVLYAAHFASGETLESEDLDGVLYPDQSESKLRHKDHNQDCDLGTHYAGPVYSTHSHKSEAAHTHKSKADVDFRHMEDHKSEAEAKTEKKADAAKKAAAEKEAAKQAAAEKSEAVRAAEARRREYDEDPKCADPPCAAEMKSTSAFAATSTHPVAWRESLHSYFGRHRFKNNSSMTVIANFGPLQRSGSIQLRKFLPRLREPGTNVAFIQAPHVDAYFDEHCKHAHDSKYAPAELPTTFDCESSEQVGGGTTTTSDLSNSKWNQLTHWHLECVRNNRWYRSFEAAKDWLPSVYLVPWE